MRKGALNERIDIYLWLLSTVVNRLSFADAKAGKDGGEKVGGGDGAGDGGKMVDGFA